MGVPLSEATNRDKHITEIGHCHNPVPHGILFKIPVPYPADLPTKRITRDSEPSIDKGHQTPWLSTTPTAASFMHPNGRKSKIIIVDGDLEPGSSTTTTTTTTATKPPLEWDWAIEHEDRKKERKADAALHGATVFEVDRRVLRDVVREKMNVEVGRIEFLSAGTFHKAYLVTLVDHTELVARVARRFMPRLKIESEVATINYLRQNTTVPVPTIYHHDSNPYNRLGGEFILMSKATGIPLAKVYHGLAYNELVQLLKNLASTILPLFAHRFNAIGSLYFGPDPRQHVASGAPTPRAQPDLYTAYPFSPTLDSSHFNNVLTPKPSTLNVPTLASCPRQFHVGPIISWPFFGSNRGELTHPSELNRGPWYTTHSYLASCVEREIQGVIRENEGKAAPHKLHLDPDEIKTSRYHKLEAIEGDESDDSDDWELEESEDEWEGPGDAMYRDYRRMQRSTFLVAQMAEREEAVKKEMGRWMGLMERLMAAVKTDEERSGLGAGEREEFGLDCHDLSLENVFVDEQDHTKITCIIDWESTTTRPLWASAHVPAFLQSSPFVTKLFRQVVAQLATDPAFQAQLDRSFQKTNSISSNASLFTNSSSFTSSKPNKPISAASLCHEWLRCESAGLRLRLAHRCAEWDGWEEGLVDSILGSEDMENEWFAFGSSRLGTQAGSVGSPAIHSPLRTSMQEAFGSFGSLDGMVGTLSSLPNGNLKGNGSAPGSGSLAGRGSGKASIQDRRQGAVNGVGVGNGNANPAKRQGNANKLLSKLPMLNEQEKEQMLDTTGDFCGGRGGELGRRLEAWLTVSGGVVTGRGRDWDVDVFDR